MNYYEIEYIPNTKDSLSIYLQRGKGLISGRLTMNQFLNYYDKYMRAEIVFVSINAFNDPITKTPYYEWSAKKGNLV